MDIHLRVTVTMVAATFVGQLTTYLCLLVFPHYWSMYDSNPSTPRCDANSIIIMRVGGGGSGGANAGDGGCGPAQAPRPADEGGGAGGGLRRRGSVQDHGTVTVPGRPNSVCTCFGMVDCPEDDGRCPNCNKMRPSPDAGQPLGPGPTGVAGPGAGRVARSPTTTCEAPDARKSNSVETYQVFTAPAPSRYNTSRHWNTVASFVLNAGLVVVMQCVQRSSLKLNTMWSAVFVSAMLALLYTLLASNNREWRTKQFTNACLITIHKFVILLSMASVLAYSSHLDPLF